jgi:hypothetical protein
MASLLQSTTIGGHAAIHAGNIGSQSVNYANSAGSVAWTNVSGRPTLLSQFTNDLGNYGGWITSAALANYLTTSQVTTSMISGLNNMLGVTTLPYSVDITVGGDADKFYAVQFWGGDQDVWRRIIIKRGYSEPAPWDPIGTGVHHGGLLLDWEGNFGGWGGAEYADRLRVFNESYTNVCADMFIWSHSMGYVFMLRGGGALYHLHSDQAINGYYQSGSPDILYSTSTLSYDDTWSGTNVYDVPAPAPLSLSQVNSTRIDGLRTKKQSLLDNRYLRQGIDISGIGNITSTNSYATNFFASNAFYLNGASYYLNSTNGGIYTNARFESATLLVAPGGNSSQWNTAFGWGNHASAGYAAASSLSGYLPLTGGTLSGTVVVNLGDVTSDTVAFKVGGPGNYDSLTIGMEDTPDYDAFIASFGNDIRFYSGKNVGTENHSFYWFTSKAGTSQHNQIAMTLDHNQNLSVNSHVYVSGGNSTQWNTAYGWGNHAVQGYLTSLPAHNHDDRYLVKGGGWYGVNLPGSRWGGFSVNGGEISFGDGLPNPSQMGILIDGAYLAGENNGFWSLPSDNNWNGRRGMSWNGTHLDFTTNSPTALFSNLRSPVFSFTDSSNNAYFTGGSDWGAKIQTDSGYIHFGPANGSYAHIYTDRGQFYFNRDILINNVQVVVNSGTWGISVTGSAGSVAWTNVSGRPTALSQFTNDISVTDNTKLPLAGGTMSGRLTLKSISGVEQTVPNDFGAYLHLGDWGVGRTAAGAVLVNTAYRADYATDLFDMNISRFTNNSGYITQTDALRPVYGDSGAHDLNISGQHATIRFSTGVWVNAPTPGNYSHVLSFNMASDNRTVQMYLGDVPGYLWWRPNQGGTWHPWERIWTSNNLTNLNQLTNGPGYITGYAETDTLQSVTNRGASTSAQVSFTKTDDHAIQVGTIRGRAVNSQGGEFIHLYERVHIGGPNGWGAANTAAPSHGLSVFGGASIGYGNSGGLSVTGVLRIASSDNLYLDTNYGQSIVGVYASTRYQGIFAMGDSYKLAIDGTTTGNLYGLAWSHPNAGGVAGNLNTHGLLVMENGTFLAAVSGSIRARDDMQAPYFYGSGSIRLGDMWGGAGLYRPSGSMVFGIENSDWIFSKAAVTQAYFSGGDGNLWMRWAGDWLSNLLGAKQNASTAINTSNIGSQSVNYAASSGTAENVQGYSASSLVTQSRGMHSGSDFPNGTLVRTSIDANGWAGNSFVMEVSGKSYGSGTPFKLVMEGYLYADTIINVSAMSYGSYFPGGLMVFRLDGKLCFWWARGSYWNSFEVHVRSADGDSWNRVTSIGDSPDPGGDKRVDCTPTQVVHSGNIGSQSVNYASSAGGVAWTNVSGRPTALSQFTNDISITDNTKLPLAGGTMTGNLTLAYSTADTEGYNALTFAPGSDDYIIKASSTYGAFGRSSFGWHINSASAFGVYSSGWVQLLGVQGDSGNVFNRGRFVVGGNFNNNAYSSVDSTRLHFGGGDSDANNHYYIGTNKQDYGGNYTKLDLRWHTGIRMGARPEYGGIRFFNNETLGSRIMSIGEGDANIRIDNNLWIGGAGGWITDLLAAKQNNLGFTPYNSTNPAGYITSSGSISGSAGSVAWGNITGRPDWMTSGSLIASHSNANSQVNSGFYENAGGGSNWPSQTWYNSINVRHSNQGNYHGFQVAMSYYDNLLWFRSYQGSGTFQSWVYAISSANIGSQSVANATTVGGYGPSNFLGKNGNSYYQQDTWIQVNGTHGLYWPAYYGGHFSANDLSSYTQFAFRGEKNGYGGFYDNYSRVNGAMYDSGGNGGVYREANGLWYWYYHVGNNSMGIGSSANSSSYVVYASGSIYATGDIVAYSDRRKKTDIVTIDSALDKVMAMRGVFYTKIDESEKGRQVGVIAQEMHEVLPEAVTYASDVDEYGVKYGNIVGVLIEAIKEQQKEIDELKAKLN